MRQRNGLAPGDERHGTINGYTNCGCKCPECREANRERQAAYRAAAALVELPPDDPAHGTRNGYDNYVCRCPRCAAANSVHVAERAQLAYSTGKRKPRQRRQRSGAGTPENAGVRP